jgi:NAD(P)H-flavin reductase
MLITGIRSKPVYVPLSPDTGGRHHLLVGHGVGISPLLNLVEGLAASGASDRASRQMLYVTDASAPDGADRVAKADVAEARVFPDTSRLLAGLRETLSGARMGLRLYVAGPEAFMGQIMTLALEFNLNKDEIRAEECGSLARRVHCVHCKTVTEDVTTNIVECTNCHRWLIVRDHYSRRFAAYMGVMVDAEAPGERPDVKVVFA